MSCHLSASPSHSCGSIGTLTSSQCFHHLERICAHFEMRDHARRLCMPPRLLLPVWHSIRCGDNGVPCGLEHFSTFAFLRLDQIARRKGATFFVSCPRRPPSCPKLAKTTKSREIQSSIRLQLASRPRHDSRPVHSWQGSPCPAIASSTPNQCFVTLIARAAFEVPGTCTQFPDYRPSRLAPRLSFTRPLHCTSSLHSTPI